MIELIYSHDYFSVRRSGRYLSVTCHRPHQVLSTAVIGGGLRDDVDVVINHQFCEGVGDVEMSRHLQNVGHAAYHCEVCDAVGAAAENAVIMSTAANMSCAAVAAVRDPEDPDLHVTTIATAGVTSNATRAGDPTTWRETNELLAIALQ